MTVFGSAYARAYDALYAEKDYGAETHRLVTEIRAHLPHATRVVDFGCGTGRHAHLLAAAGYEVVGVERSEDMLAVAQADAGACNPQFVHGDLRRVRLGRTFDVALMMFAVLGYQVSDADLQSSLATVRAHLQPGGLFIADLWYGPAVMALGVSPHLERTIRDGEREIVREAYTTVHAERHYAEVRYVLRTGREVLAEETHAMRFFFPDELQVMCARTGMELIELRAFDTDAPASTESWNVLLVARATA